VEGRAIAGTAPASGDERPASPRDPASPPPGGPPLRLHEANTRYLELDGKPVVLITSGEHYGALLNLDFDYERYLETLGKEGFNLTRVFSGAYVEPQGAFNIARNTLAPARDRFIAPWARSDTKGYANGGNKFDLARFNEAYFERLEKLMTAAEKHGVVVELVLFCPFYKDDQWVLSPMNAKNNVNGVGAIERESVYTLDRNGDLLEIQEKMTREIVRRLNRFRNLYYEVCNEPYFGGVTDAWQRRITDVIVETERELPVKHLISWNIANGKAKVEKPHPAVSIFNFHYASPPDAVALNAHLERVIGDNETGFKGTGDDHYRMEGWEFILAGGGLYNHLDYSFVVGLENGTFEFPETQPGGGGPALRKQLRALSELIHSFDFVRMAPDRKAVRADEKDAKVTALVEPGRQYAIYVRGGTKGSVGIELPPGEYRAEWLDPKSAKKLGSKEITVAPDAKVTTFAPPSYPGEIALAVRRKDK
ncbi:MAG TPA: DUF4038 domain-containing protein, partial [Planctomycetota bacterium]|nr:DUF4038 domain-containing protein [Planctomycetota bacterium]